MVAREPSESPAGFAERLALAIAAEKKNPTRVAREAKLAPGYIFKLLGAVKGAKQIFAPGPDVIRGLADTLNVSYEWLAIGRGPMRAIDWAESPLERAMLFARTNHAREDAIEAAAERYRDHAEQLTAWDWIMAIDGEARRLDRLGVPRPEETRRKQGQLRRAAKVRATLLAAQDRPPAAPRTRAPARRQGAK